MTELDVGKATERGVELAAEKVIEEGILSELSVTSTGTGGKSSGAVDGHNYLTNRENVDVTLGTFAEQTAAAIMPNIASSETIHLNVGAVSPKLPAKVAENYEKYKYWFRFGPPNSIFFGVDDLKFAQHFIKEEQNWTTTAIFRENAGWTDAVAPHLKKELPKMGIKVKDDIVFSLSEENYSSYYSDLADLDVDCIFGLIAEAGKGPLLGYEKADMKTPMVGDLVAAQSPEFLKDTDSDSLNLIPRTFSTWGANLSDKAKTFIDQYEKRYDKRPSKPTWAAFAAYAATRMYADAVASTDDVDGVISAIENGSFSLNQTYEVFKPDEQDPITGNVYPHDLKYGEGQYYPTWSQWQDGEQKTVWPPNLANAEFQQY